MGTAGFRPTLDRGEPLADVTVVFRPGINDVLATAHINSLADDFDLWPRPWYDDPRLRTGTATRAALHRLFGWTLERAGDPRRVAGPARLLVAAGHAADPLAAGAGAGGRVDRPVAAGGGRRRPMVRLPAVERRFGRRWSGCGRPRRRTCELRWERRAGSEELATLELRDRPTLPNLDSWVDVIGRRQGRPRRPARVTRGGAAREPSRAWSPRRGEGPVWDGRHPPHRRRVEGRMKYMGCGGAVSTFRRRSPLHLVGREGVGKNLGRRSRTLFCNSVDFRPATLGDRLAADPSRSGRGWSTPSRSRRAVSRRETTARPSGGS